MAKHNAVSIANELRKRICLAPPTDSVILHEQILADEFGVSRTPVRQALQRLAYERLVEVRSGVGTVVSALDPARREEDIKLAFGLLRIAAEIAGDLRLSDDARAQIATLEQQLARSSILDVDAKYAIRSTSLEIITREMSSDILAEALKAAMWRLFRWRMAEVATAAPSVVEADLRNILARMVQATSTGSVHALLKAQVASDEAP